MYIECGDECDKVYCCNKTIQRGTWKLVSAFVAGNKGTGLLIDEDCNMGELICEYTGIAITQSTFDVSTEKEYVILLQMEQKPKMMVKYILMQKNKEVYADTLTTHASRIATWNCGGQKVNLIWC